MTIEAISSDTEFFGMWGAAAPSKNSTARAVGPPLRRSLAPRAGEAARGVPHRGVPREDDGPELELVRHEDGSVGFEEVPRDDYDDWPDYELDVGEAPGAAEYAAAPRALSREGGWV
ncbi:MAG: hypothetical protein Q4B54_06760 [Coriobacteriales bacterium]|nr:hypothetical protein [Coriobacteriales bacterium]